MIYENNYFIVNYSDNDKAYITDLIQTINENIASVMSFFKLTELKQKKTINLWNSLDKYKRYVEFYVGEYQKWRVADTFNKNINILSYDLYLSGESHKNCNISDYKKVIVHEIVHACQQEINPNATDVSWFWEALATNLSNQKRQLLDIPYSKNELLKNFRHMKDAYSISYTIGRYLIENYSNEDIIQYVKNPQKLIDDTETILTQTKLWVQSKKV